MQSVQAIPLCAFRKKRPVPGTPGQVEFFCLAADQQSLGRVGSSQAALREICGQCPITEEMARNEPACAFLRPIRLIDENRAFFPCRNAPGVFRKKWPADMRICTGCQFGFPRPPLEHIAHYAEDIHRLHRNVQPFLEWERDGRDGANKSIRWQKQLRGTLRSLWMALSHHLRPGQDDGGQ